MGYFNCPLMERLLLRYSILAHRLEVSMREVLSYVLIINCVGTVFKD